MTTPRAMSRWIVVVVLAITMVPWMADLPVPFGRGRGGRVRQ